MGLWNDFKKFATQAGFVNMAVGIVIGVAIGALVAALVADLVNPLIGVAFHANFSNVGKVTVHGSQFFFGAFLSALINFLVVLMVIFLALVYPMAKMQERRDARAAKAPPTTKKCPECQSTIDINARRCAFCTSTLTPAPSA
ncbi:MAG: MscL family protein [Thermoplasmata archaeon]|nr:MscL family protein [Thermoplasmata archaeon]